MASASRGATDNTSICGISCFSESGMLLVITTLVIGAD